MIASLADRLLAMGTWLISVFQIEGGPATFSVLCEASLLALGIAAVGLIAWYATRGALAIRAAANPDPLSRLRIAAALMQSLTPVAVVAAGVIVIGPVLTRLDRSWADVAVWLSVAIALVVATRSTLLLLGDFASILRNRSLRSEGLVDDLLVELGWQVVRTGAIFGALYVATITLFVPESAQRGVDAFLGLAVIGLIAWMLVALVGIGDRFLRNRFRIDVADNLQARRVYTQLMVMRRLAYLLIGILALALALMQFEGIRRIGTSILASAGLAGVIIGFAAQRTLANLLAGIQIALTQPLRIDDVVLMEGECGRIEEVTLTYVVVAVWDQRRLIIPLSRIIENPFQNWTRTGSRLLGTVTMRCDFRVPVEAMRAEAKRLVEGDARWDRQAFAFQVTDWAERSVEVRVLLSANDSGALFDLRCAVREALLAWLGRTDPASLPRMRLEPGSPTADGTATVRSALGDPPPLLAAG